MEVEQVEAVVPIEPASYLDPATATVKPVEAPIASVPIPPARVAAPGPDPVPKLVD